jgi:hypothetical protein
MARFQVRFEMSLSAALRILSESFSYRKSFKTSSLVVSRVLLTDRSKTGFMISFMERSIAMARHYRAIGIIDGSMFLIRDSEKTTRSGRV